MNNQLVRVSESDGLSRVEMRHGVNALNLGLITALREALSALRERGAPPFLLLSGHPRVFCPGWDLKSLDAVSVDDVRLVLDGFEALVLELFSYPGPTVAGVEGHAIAGGCLVALACDRRVMCSTGRLGLSEVNLGVPIPAGCVEMLRARLSAAATERLMLAGEGFSAEGGSLLGIVHQAVEPKAFAETCEREMRTLASKPHDAYVAAKTFLHRETWSRMARRAPEEAATFIDEWQRPETQERIRDLIRSWGR